jgi:Flp pilus assembly protein CpaB
MRSRGLVVAIAVVLAVAAAAAVILYTQGVKEEAQGGGSLETVIVSTQQIVPNEPLDPLLEQGVFKQIRVPQEALVSDAVRDTTELEGATSTATIYANEQIPASRLSTGERPNSLGISDGHLGVAFEFDAPQGGAGNIQPGDEVSVFATYQDVQATSATGVQQGLSDFTATLVPTVKVLRIENPQIDSETGEQSSNNDRIRVTLDLLPKEAQDVVFAQENGLVWLGLLPPNEEGASLKASTVPIEFLRGARLG